MSEDKPEEITVVVDDGASDAPADSGPTPESQEEGKAPRFRFRRTWAELRPGAPFTVFVSWAAVVVLVAMARVDPWNEWKSWRKWLRADERGWELAIPGILAAAATWLIIKAHDRWGDEGWSPEIVAMVMVGIGAAVGAALWGLFALDLRPFAG